ncbi:MAG: hypothetical protein KA764_14710 [Anaerolineales bacterium]|nr:hypothetical protein [Anaerolineales bacterium]
MFQPRFWSDRALLAYTGGAALTLAAAWQWGGGETLLLLAAPLWLIPLAVYDLRCREVPHLAWVAGPCLLAFVIAVLRGDWALSLLALISVVTSERWRRPARQRRPILLFGLTACGWLLTGIAAPLFIAAAAVLGFWLMFELGWWAGADALAALTLILLRPTAGVVLAIGLAHLIWAVTLKAAWRWPRPQSSDELVAHGQPGLPALALAAGLNAIWCFLF